MRKIWANNLLIKLLSLALATILWIVVVNIADPVKNKTFYDIPVHELNKDVIKSHNKVYEIEEGDKVDVTITGKKSVVDSIKSSDIEATADLRNISFANSVTIEVECAKATSGGATVELGKVKNMVLNLEEITDKKIAIIYNIVGSVGDGYYVSNDLITSTPTSITVSGAKSVVERIKTVCVDIDVDNKTSSFSVDVEPKAYDEEGKIVESSNLEFGVDTVAVDVTIWPTKSIPVEFEISGKPKTGYKYIGMTYDPKEFLFAGKKSDLDKLTSIKIPVNIKDATQNIEKEFDLTSFMPSGVILAEQYQNVIANIQIEKLVESEITIPLKSIEVRLPDGITEYKYINPEDSYKVKIRGQQQNIDKVTLDTLKPYLNLTDKGLGKHNITLQFDTESEVEIVGSTKITVELFENKEETVVTEAPTQEE